MIYRQKFKILSAICDHTDHLNIWGLAKIFQESADEHTALLNIGFDALMQNGQAWILTRFYYAINQMPTVGEEVEVSTWSKGHNGLLAFRDFQMKNSAGEVLACGSSCWAVINFNTRRVVRLHDMLNDFEHHPIEGTDRPTLNKIVFPTDAEVTKELDYDVHYSSIDHNHHTNNSEYLRWICDTLDEPEKLRRIQIDYVTETKLGEHVNVVRKDADGKSFFQITNPRGIAVNAVVEH